MIALDTSAVICLIERIEPARSEMVEILASDRTAYIVSVMAVTECLTGPMRHGDLELQRAFDDFFMSGDCRVVAMDHAIAVQAARWRAAHRLKAPDAIHLATAIAAGATAFVSTDDRDYSRLVELAPLRLILLPRKPDPRPS